MLLDEFFFAWNDIVFRKECHQFIAFWNNSFMDGLHFRLDTLPITISFLLFYPFAFIPRNFIFKTTYLKFIHQVVIDHFKYISKIELQILNKTFVNLLIKINDIQFIKRDIFYVKKLFIFYHLLFWYWFLFDVCFYFLYIVELYYLFKLY